MSKRTAMLVPPTLEEVKLAAAKIGLPERESEKFFHYYESNGWKVGKNRMLYWRNALAHWRLVWMDRQDGAAPKRHWAEKELDRLAKESGV